MTRETLDKTDVFCYTSGVTERANALPPLTTSPPLEGRQMAIPKVQPESASRKPLTQERLQALLHYDQETGVFTWRVPRKGTGGIGSVAGRVNPGNGYVDICVDYRRYLGHRLAWLYMTGQWPPEDIDHKDRVRTNNAWNNLRLATRAQNIANAGKRRGSKNPYKGIQRSGKNGWQAVICARGRRYCLGCFPTAEQAAAAYRAAAVRFNGEFAA